MEYAIYGALGGLAVALVVFMVMVIRINNLKSTQEKEIARFKQVLTDRMEVESEGVAKLKKENEELKKQNENLRISLQSYAQKPGRKEIQRLTVYQQAADRLTINSPGFGAAWQAALKESEEEFEKTYTGLHPFIRKIIPMRTDATIIREIEDNG